MEKNWKGKEVNDRNIVFWTSPRRKDTDIPIGRRKKKYHRAKSHGGKCGSIHLVLIVIFSYRTTLALEPASN